MTHRIIALLLAVCSAAAGCAQQPKPKPPRDITSYLLRESEKPKGTILDAGDSGPQTLDQYAGGDPIKKRDFAAAGFVTSYFELFVSPEAIQSGKLKPGSALAISFALEFRDAAGSTKGLSVLRTAVLREGENLKTIAPPGFGRASFGLAGTLQKKRPPGFLFAWTLDKYVLGLIAVGSPGSISEEATRALAGVMAAHGSE